MGQKEVLKKEIKKVFHSNLIYLITGSGFMIVLIIGFIIGFEPINLFLISILGAIFFYVCSILLITKILSKTLHVQQNQEAKFDRILYRYNLLYWYLKSRLILNEFKDFQENIKGQLDEYRFSMDRQEIMKDNEKTNKN